MASAVLVATADKLLEIWCQATLRHAHSFSKCFSVPPDTFRLGETTQVNTQVRRPTIANAGASGYKPFGLGGL